MDIEIPDNVYALASEPFPDITIDQLKDALQQRPDEQTLAVVYAGVSNKVGWLMHCLDDDDCTLEIEEKFRCWNDFEELLCSRIFSILEKEAEWLEYKAKLTNQGYYVLLIPFMERNGFFDGGGWWIRNDGNCR